MPIFKLLHIQTMKRQFAISTLPLASLHRRCFKESIYLPGTLVTEIENLVDSGTLQSFYKKIDHYQALCK